jgi:hypothetical protein
MAMLNWHQLKPNQDILKVLRDIDKHMGLQKDLNWHQLRVETYHKPQQWHDAKHPIDEFKRIVTYRAPVSMLPLCQFEAPISFLL